MRLALGRVRIDEELACRGEVRTLFPGAPFVFGAGILGLLYTMFGWWYDVTKEATHQGYHTRVVQISHRYGMILFIASEVMFFVAFFWAYFHFALFPEHVSGAT